MTVGTTKQISSRIPELDGVRGIAILGVIYWHFFEPFPDSHASMAGRFLSELGSFSWGGVDLFFVLSGFLIGGILLDNLNAANLFSVFYTRRALRILPLYYAWLIIAVPIATFLHFNNTIRLAFEGRFDWWIYFTHSQNIAFALRGSQGAGWLSPTWSLAVEEQFYLLFPVTLWLLKPRLFLPFAFAMIPIAFTIRWVLIRHGYSAAAGALLPARADALLLGVIGAWIYRQPSLMKRIQTHAVLFHGLLVALLLLCYLGARAYTPVAGAIEYTFLAFASLIFILLAVVSPWRAVLRMRWLMRLGNIAYGVYIFHFGLVNLILGLANDCGLGRVPHVIPMVKLIAVVAVIFAAAASFRFFEAPLLRFGHQIRYRNKQGEFYPSTITRNIGKIPLP